jgi:hypothetical protein
MDKINELIHYLDSQMDDVRTYRTSDHVMYLMQAAARLFVAMEEEESKD